MRDCECCCGIGFRQYRVGFTLRPTRDLQAPPKKGLLRRILNGLLVSVFQNNCYFEHFSIAIVAVTPHPIKPIAHGHSCHTGFWDLFELISQRIMQRLIRIYHRSVLRYIYVNRTHVEVLYRVLFTFVTKFQYLSFNTT